MVKKTHTRKTKRSPQRDYLSKIIHFNKNMLFFVISCTLLLAGIIFVFSFHTYPQYQSAPLASDIPTATPTITPYPKGAVHIFASRDFTKHNYNPQEQIKGRFTSINIYPQTILDVLSSTSDSDLVGFRCIPGIWNDKWSGTIYYTPSDTALLLNDSYVKSFIQKINARVGKDQIVNGYSMCQTDDGRIIINYSTYQNGEDNLEYITEKTFHFAELDSKNTFHPITDIYLPGYSNCGNLLEVTKIGMFFYDCEEGDGTAGHDYFYKIDTIHQTSQLLMQCDLDTEEASSTCN